MPIEMNGVQAWITVGDKVQVAEYEVDLDLATNTATCWISGEPGQVCPTPLHVQVISPFLPQLRADKKRSSWFAMINLVLFHSL